TFPASTSCRLRDQSEPWQKKKQAKKNRPREHDPVQARLVNDRLSFDEMLFDVAHGAPSGMWPRQRFKCALLWPHASLHVLNSEKLNTGDPEVHKEPQRNLLS